MSKQSWKGSTLLNPVYGVRSRRDTDTFFKRFTAEGFYHLMNALGADIVFNHADYRLISARVLESFADYKEVNIFLRGMVPLVGFPSATVSYERHERLAGESHYPLRKMLALAFDGITSLSNKPIRLITGAGIVVSLISFIGVIWAIVQSAMGSVVAGWASTVCIVCFMGGVQLICRFAKEDEHFIGISQSRNRGHQNAVLAGLMEAKASDWSFCKNIGAVMGRTFSSL